MNEWHLGTNFGHDAAAAAIGSSGELELAIEEGRITGEKDCRQFPINSILQCVEAMGCPPKTWSEGWRGGGRFWWKGAHRLLTTARVDPAGARRRMSRESERFAEWCVWRLRLHHRLPRPRTVGHHLAHAWSLVPWGLRPGSLILVSDGTAERACISTFHWDGERFLPLRVSHWPHSLGGLYHQAAYHVGFTGQRGPGKLMALSAFGSPLDESLRLVEVRDGRVVVDQSVLATAMQDGAWRNLSPVATSGFRRMVGEADQAEEGGADFAATIQALFTTHTIELAFQSVDIARGMGLCVDSVGLVGGAAMNCETNGALRRMLANVGLSLLVSPWSNDSGTAIGAAAFGASLKGIPVRIAGSALLGPGGTGKPKEIDVTPALDCLAAGRAIGLVSGGVEFGPRALGGRCLLMDASRTDSKMRLNTFKGRPQFMPFAPAILDEDWSKYLSEAGSEIMSWTSRVRPEIGLQFPGLAHPSGETRAQLVKARSAPLLWTVLDGWRRRTGDSLLLLTSLNGAGEPMLSHGPAAAEAARRLGAAGCVSDMGWESFL